MSDFWSNRSKKDDKFRFSLDRSLNPPESHALRNRRISGHGLTSREVRKRIKTDYNVGMDQLYRVPLKDEENALRIVAPFIDHALNPAR